MISQATSKSHSSHIQEESALYDRSSIASEDEFFFSSLRSLFDLIQNTQEFDLQCK